MSLDGAHRQVELFTDLATVAELFSYLTGTGVLIILVLCRQDFSSSAIASSSACANRLG
jgi:uncharacterized membrane protein YdcZ (DUF606 family)